jgi:hypothetical protein
MIKIRISFLLLVSLFLVACGGSQKPEVPAQPGIQKFERQIGVSYKKTYKEMIDDAEFDSNNFTAPLPTYSPARNCPDQAVVVTVINFGKELSFDEAKAELEKQGLRPASFMVVLSFAKQELLEQLDKNIVCLGKFQKPLHTLLHRHSALLDLQALGQQLVLHNWHYHKH